MSTYRATYKARFQSSYCDTSPPVILVSCEGSNSSIEILKTSHPTILCDATVKANVPGANASSVSVSCESTCDSKETCEDVCLFVNGSSPFGSIEFQCSGNKISNAAGSMTFEGTNGQVWTNSSSLFQTGQLGVACPSDSYGVNHPDPPLTDYSYLYDDYFVQCIRGRGYRYTIPSQSNESYSYAYFCSAATQCAGVGYDSECVAEPFTIRANVQSFQTTCVEPPLPLSHKLPSTSSEVKYTARFDAAWGHLAVLESSSRSTCSVAAPTVQMVCHDGEIQLVAAAPSSTACTTVETGILECTDDTGAWNVLDQQRAVVYECTSVGVPTTRLQYPEIPATCVNRLDEDTFSVSHAVQLGVVCSTGSNVFVSDAAVQCASSRPQVPTLYQEGQSRLFYERMTCFETGVATIDTAFNVTVPTVAMETNDFWAKNPVAECLTIVSGVNHTPRQIPLIAPAHKTMRRPLFIAGGVGCVVLVAMAIWMRRRHSRRVMKAAVKRVQRNDVESDHVATERSDDLPNGTVDNSLESTQSGRHWRGNQSRRINESDPSGAQRKSTTWQHGLDPIRCSIPTRLWSPVVGPRTKSTTRPEFHVSDLPEFKDQVRGVRPRRDNVDLSPRLPFEPPPPSDSVFRETWLGAGKRPCDVEAMIEQRRQLQSPDDPTPEGPTPEEQAADYARVERWLRIAQGLPSTLELEVEPSFLVPPELLEQVTVQAERVDVATPSMALASFHSEGESRLEPESEVPPMAQATLDPSPEPPATRVTWNSSL